MSLEDALDRYCAVEDLTDQPAGAASKCFKFAKIPEILTIQLCRYTNELKKTSKTSALPSRDDNIR